MTASTIERGIYAMNPAVKVMSDLFNEEILSAVELMNDGRFDLAVSHAQRIVDVIQGMIDLQDA